MPQVMACTVPPGLGAIIVTRAPGTDTDIEADLRDNFAITSVMSGGS